MSRIVHVVGTGTIGEPLIGLLADHKEAFGVDEVTFHKRTPLVHERMKVEDLVRRGAALAVDDDRWSDFEALGHAPKFTKEEAIDRATVVIDCTPAGNSNKDAYYANADGPIGFLAQGSETGFGKMYAFGINDTALDRHADRFLTVVSCNTHNLSVLISALGLEPDGEQILESGHFVCMRRSNDISQDKDFAPSPIVGKHDNPRFGTHHARDAHAVFATMGYDLDVFSSSIKLNTQYMHEVWFSLKLTRDMDLETVVRRLANNPRVALTYRTSANSIFSFGRDHGYFGRILSQTVLSQPTLHVRGNREIVGFCFTPQDGNALLSSIAATLWYMHGDGFDQRLDVIRRFLFQEV